MFNWLLKKLQPLARKKRFERVMKKYGKSVDRVEECEQSIMLDAFREAYIYEGDITYLIDWLDLRSPKDYRYETYRVQCMFRGLLVESVFRQYDSVRYMLREGWKGIEKILDDRERQERILKNFPKPRK